MTELLPVADDGVARRREPAAPTGGSAFWFLIMLATAMLLGGTSVAVGAYLSAGLPDTVVRDYFAALARGDAPTALGYGPVPGASHDMLTSDVLAAQQQTAPITDFAVTGWRTTNGQGQVTVSYTLGFASGPQQVTDNVPVEFVGHTWRLVTSAVAVHLGTAAGSDLASIAGSAIPSGVYAVFPGAVPVRYDTPNLELSRADRVVRFADSVNLLQVTVDAQVTPAGQQAIGAAVRQALVECLAGRSPAEVLCPVPEPGFDVPGSLRGKVIGPLSGDMAFAVSTTDGRVDVTGDATVNATYGQLDENDIAVSRDTDVVRLKAYCYATDPGHVSWDAS